MGFLDGIRKMMQGKPVFEDPNRPEPDMTAQTLNQFDSKVASTPVDPLPAKVTTPQQSKVTPTFDLRHCQTRIDGEDCMVTIWVTNTSSVDIEIDKCVILNTKMEVDRRLSPGQAHEITLYKGRTPKTDQAHKANIFYKAIRENAYFRVDFTVEYTRGADGVYMVEDLHPEHYAIKELA
jgi:hypothetical protein